MGSFFEFLAAEPSERQDGQLSSCVDRLRDVPESLLVEFGKSLESPVDLLTVGNILESREACGDALAIYELAWEQAKRWQSPPLRSLTCRALADCHRQIGNRVLGQQFEQLALSADLEAPHEDLLPTVRWKLESVFESQSRQAHQACLQGSWDEAFRLWEHCLHLGRAIGDEEGCLKTERLMQRVRGWIQRLSSDPSRN